MDSLKRTAKHHFETARFSKAYGCLRLAHALSAHFHKEECRDLETEFEVVADCLYYLRRTIGEPHTKLSYDSLQYLLSGEIQGVIDEKKIIPSYGGLCLLIELGSWLNELGWSKVGSDVLRKASNRSGLCSRQMPTDVASRFHRQRAGGLIQTAEDTPEIEQALQMANGCDASLHNKMGVYNARLYTFLRKEDHKGAIGVVKQECDYFERQTDYFFGPLERLGPSIQSFLAYMSLSIIAEGSKAYSQRYRRRLRDRLEALRIQEYHYGRATTLNRVPGLSLAVQAATRNLADLEKFLEVRLFPLLPQYLADLIIRIADQL